MAKIEQQGLQHVTVENKPEPVTRDQVERLVCALLTSPHAWKTHPHDLVNTAKEIASEINSRNFSPSIHEQTMAEHLADTREHREGRRQFAEQISQAAAMAEKEFRGKSDG